MNMILISFTPFVMGCCLSLRSLHEETENASPSFAVPLVSAALAQNGLPRKRPQPAASPFTGFLGQWGSDATAI